MNIKTKIAAGLTTGAFVASMLTSSAFAATTVKVKGNGALSSTAVGVVSVNANVVNQSNNTVVVNGVKATSNTGGNSSSFNTGGTSTVTTGNANTTVTNTTTGGNNTATVNNCGCQNGDTKVVVSGNGAFSQTWVGVGNINLSYTGQSSNTIVGNFVYASSNTGKNSSNFNTGGNSGVDTGNAHTTVENTVEGGSNTLNP